MAGYYESFLGRKSLFRCGMLKIFPIKTDILHFLFSLYPAISLKTILVYRLLWKSESPNNNRTQVVRCVYSSFARHCIEAGTRQLVF